MRRHDVDRLLAFSSRLQGISTFETLLELVCAEVQDAVGFRTVWVAVVEPDGEHGRILMQQGADVWDEAMVVPLAGDVHLQRVISSLAPVVVVDAQVDPDVNREVVAALGNRTIVHVPMTFIDVPFGALGMGTYGDEGVRVPTDDELLYLQGLASQIVVASSRLILLREREQAAQARSDMERMLAERQRLESLGQLAGGIAHDFNNLLSAILGAAALLRSEVTDQAHLHDLELIEQAAERASDLTARLLALGKRQALRFEPTDANALLRQVLGLVSRVIKSDIVIEVVEGEGLPAVHGDSRQLEQVFMNLFLNARDAMPEGGRLAIVTDEVVVDDEFVHLHPWARPGRYVVVTVSDTGSGMTDEVRQRVFEPFFTTKDESRGTGLGLAVCRGIVEQHGGLLHLYSEPGLGTTFRVYLPTTTSSVPSSDEVVEARTEPAAVTVHAGTERILVADDQPYVRDIVERILTRAGYAVTVVDNGRTAVDHVRTEAVDLVILDAVMPELGGREAYAQIRAARPDVPVLFASGYGGDELATRFLTDTGVPLIPKPFDPTTLLAAVRRLLDEAAATR